MSNLVFLNRTHHHSNRSVRETSKFVKNIRQTTVAEALAKACRQGYKDIMCLRKGNNDLFLSMNPRVAAASCTAAALTTHEAVSVDPLPTIHVYMYCRCTVKEESCHEKRFESVSDYIHLSTEFSVLLNLEQ